MNSSDQSLKELSDEFNDQTTLNQWLTAQDISSDEDMLPSMDINVTNPGHMYIVPKAGTWFGDNTGHLSYKMVSGDFVVTMRVKVIGKSSSIPTGMFDLAGLMARTPSQVEGEVVQSGNENWEYFTTGGFNNTRIIDYKQNVNSQPNYGTKEVNTEWIELRMARIGSTFVKLYREDGQEEWNLANIHDRNDLPDALQVGICILTNLDGEPDHTITIDYIRYDNPQFDKEMGNKIKQNEVTPDDWKTALSD